MSSTVNTKRSLFGFHGIFGILISVVGLVIFWAILMTYALLSQQQAAKKPYSDHYLRDGKSIQMISTANAQYAFPEPTTKK